MYQLALLARRGRRESTEYWYLRKAAKRGHQPAVDMMGAILDRDGPDDEEDEDDDDWEWEDD